VKESTGFPTSEDSEYPSNLENGSDTERQFPRRLRIIRNLSLSDSFWESLELNSFANSGISLRT
jgi:hypothetical protein